MYFYCSRCGILDLSELHSSGIECFPNSLAFALSFRHNNFSMIKALDDFFVNNYGNIQILKSKYFSHFNILQFPKTDIIC